MPYSCQSQSAIARTALLSGSRYVAGFSSTDSTSFVVIGYSMVMRSSPLPNWALMDQEATGVACPGLRRSHTPLLTVKGSLRRYAPLTVSLGAYAHHASSRSEEHTSELQSRENLV